MSFQKYVAVVLSFSIVSSLYVQNRDLLNLKFKRKMEFGNSALRSCNSYSLQQKFLMTSELHSATAFSLTGQFYSDSIECTLPIDLYHGTEISYSRPEGCEIKFLN
jgi:hypothetical protein